MQRLDAGGWIVSLNQVDDPKARLLCLPFEGGSAAFYQTWIEHLRIGVELLAVELPGHGERAHEPALTDMSEQVRLIMESSFEHIHDKPLLVFGHGVGSLLAYELVLQFAAAELPMPKQLLVSGCQAPGDAKSYFPAMSHLDDQDFFEDLVTDACLAQRLMTEPEAVAMELDSIRADYRLREHYQASNQPKLSIPLAVFAGSRDLIPLGNLLEWQQVALQPVHVCVFKGDHFFIEDDKVGLLNHVNELFDEVIVTSACA